MTGQAILDEEGLFELVFDVRDVQHVRSIPEKAAVAKLDQIASLREGWRGPGSRVPTNDLLALIEDLIPSLRGTGSSSPSVRLRMAP